MTPSHINAVIAEWMGWKRREDLDYVTGIPTKPDISRAQVFERNGEILRHDGLPDYYRDLNAVHEAEGKLRDGDVQTFEAHLNAVIAKGCCVCDFSLLPGDKLWHATAAQRAEALVRVIGKWEE
jgi:hypothetical protein